MRSLLCVVVVLVACGGGGGTKPTKPTPPTAGSGSAVADKKPDPAAKPVDPPKADPMSMDCKDLNCLIAQMDVFAKKMCECKDKKCADKLQNDFMEWGTKIGDKPELKDLKPSDDETKRATEIVQKYTECMMKYMGGEDTEEQPPTNTGLGGGLKK